MLINLVMESLIIFNTNYLNQIPAQLLQISTDDNCGNISCFLDRKSIAYFSQTSSYIYKQIHLSFQRLHTNMSIVANYFPPLPEKYTNKWAGGVIGSNLYITYQNLYNDVQKLNFYAHSIISIDANKDHTIWTITYNVYKTSSSKLTVNRQVIEAFFGNEITASMFQRCLRRITLPNTVTKIGNRAFKEFTFLKEIHFNNVTSIGNYAFCWCPELHKLKNTSSLESIGEYAFYGCRYLDDYFDLSSTTYIGNYAFGMCTALSNLPNLPIIKTINHGVFYNCSELKGQINLPCVNAIGKFAFNNCYSLTGTPYLPAIITIDTYAFCQCIGLTGNLYLNENTYIGDNAFYECILSIWKGIVEISKSINEDDFPIYDFLELLY